MKNNYINFSLFLFVKWYCWKEEGCKYIMLISVSSDEGQM